MFQPRKILNIFIILCTLLVFNLSIAAEPSPETQGSAEQAKTKITKVMVNDQADSEGYVTESNLTISPTVHHIYVTIELENAVANATTVGVDLTGPNLKTGGVSDIKKSGLVLKSFDFVRQKPWSVGEYQVDVALPEGEKQSIKFTIKE